jgi:succinoglycan biosynthesis transport protein ExoP
VFEPLLLPDSCSNLPARSRFVDVQHSLAPGVAGGSLVIEYGTLVARHKLFVVLLPMLAVVLAIAWTVRQPRIYQAHAVLESRNLNENFLNMRDVSPTAADTTGTFDIDLQTQINILQSETVLRRVIRRPDLNPRLSAAGNSGLLARWRAGRRVSPQQTEALLSSRISADLRVTARAGTRLIDVSYDSSDPALAADVINALAAEYMREVLQARRQSSQQTGEWLTQQMDDIRVQLERSEEQLQSYARESGLLFTSEKDNIAETRLRQLQDELSQAQAARVLWQSKFELASTAAPEALPEVLDSTILKDYQVKLTDLRRQGAELAASLTPAHPSVKKVQAQVGAMETALERERTNITRRIQNEYEAARSRERLLAASYDAQARLVTEQAAKVAHYGLLKREVDNNRQLYDSMLQHVKEADIASTLHASNVRVIDPAQVPARPYKPNAVVNSAVGLLTGLFTALAVIFVRSRLDQSIRVPGQVASSLNVPELGVIPSARSERSRYFAYYRSGRPPRNGGKGTPARKTPLELITSQPEGSILADFFRSTVASIVCAGERGCRPRVIAVTSANPREGKTTIAANLALALAEIGRRVLLIDGDLRRPRLHDIFDVSNSSGLSDVNGKGANALAGAIVPTRYANVHILPAGSAPANIAKTLYSAGTRDFLKRVRDDFDVVLIDTPPMLHIPDARVLGRLADAVILVVRSAQTTREAAGAATRRLIEDGALVLGTVLNEWDPRDVPAGYYYEYSGR